MRNVLIASNIMLLAIVLFLFFRNNKCKPSCAYPLCTDYSLIESRGIINAGIARQMSENYKLDSGKKYVWNGNYCTNEADATSIWFDMEKIKKFIWEIEAKKCRDNCNDLLGIRIYYGRYPKTTDMDMGDLAGLSPGYANHHSLFMVPTYFDSNIRRHIDYDPYNGCRGPFDFSPAAKPGLMLFAPGGDVQNHGSLMPPPAGAGAFPTNGE